MKQAPVQIKICGLTRPEDCLAVNASKPDYAGFVFAPGRRQVSPELAGHLIRLLDHEIRPAGVFVEESIGRLYSIIKETDLQVVQLHDAAIPGRIQSLRQILTAGYLYPAIWQRLAVQLDQPAALALKVARQTIARFQEQGQPGDLPDAWLLDSCRPGQAGGTGEPFDWSVFQDFCREHPIILAGGLSVNNIGEALKQLHPMIVDCSSGVESDGRKDPAMIAGFCAAVRGYNQRCCT